MNIRKARDELLKGKTIYDMKLKVVYYGRVSTDKEEQLNSLENQKNYFIDLIDNNKNWTNIGGYIDEGISGTQVNKREEFLKMIEDAKNNKFDLILTKEISRFSRNTIDSIKYTELLLKYGVIVYFISDNINTIYPDSEFRLTIMASMAQDEVRKLSERVKFGIKRSIKEGKLGGSCLYGYNKEKCRLTINKKEAEVVKKIYKLYITKEYTLKEISKILEKQKIYTRHNKVFSETTLKKMITNPRYKGYYTANLSSVEDYKTHKKQKNPKEEWIIYKDKNGIVPKIVSEQIWELANEIINNKKLIRKKQTNKYTKILYCKKDNENYIRAASGNRKNNPVWQCNKYLRKGLKECNSPIIYEKQLDSIIIKIISEIIDKEKIFEIINNNYIDKNLEKIIIEKINIKENLDRYIKLLIDKIKVSNINNRNKIILEINLKYGIIKNISYYSSSNKFYLL